MSNTFYGLPLLLTATLTGAAFAADDGHSLDQVKEALESMGAIRGQAPAPRYLFAFLYPLARN